MNIFTYGSLMFSEVWQELVAGQYENHRATLAGYQRSRIRYNHYPVIVPSPRKPPVPGRLYLHVSLADVARLDRFEVPFYDRRQVWVRARHTDYPIKAFAWALKPAFSHLAGPSLWTEEAFRQSGLTALLKSCLKPH